MSPSKPDTNQLKTSRMWPVWLLFFFQYAAIGVYFTFINVYFRNAGLSGTDIGLLNMISALVGVAGSIGWGYLSDLTSKPHIIISAGAAGALISAQFIPHVSGFWAFLLFSSLGSLMNSAPGTLVDSTTLVLLGNQREDYGRYRLGGSFGYIIATILSGFIFQRFGLQLIFPGYGIVMGSFAVAALWLPAVSIHIGSQGSKKIGMMIRQSTWLIFISCIFLCWIGVNASISFLSVSLNAMGASQSLIGIASTIPAMVEIPFMFFSGALLRRFGPVRLMALSMVLMVMRYFLLGWMPTPVWAIPINTLNGPAFVFFWNSAITYANRMAPKGMAGTAQGLIASTTNLAGVVSSLLTGWLFDQLGPNGIFVVMAFLALGALLIFTLGNLFKKTSPILESDEYEEP